MKLSNGDEAKVSKPSTTGSEAYQAYLKGRYQWNRRTAENLQKAIEQFTATVEKDPELRSGLYRSCRLLCSFRRIFRNSDRSDINTAAVENTIKIIDFDPNYAGAYNMLGLSYLKLGRNAEAIANFEKAVKMSNRAAVVIRNLGYAYGATGKRAEALAIAKELEEKFEKKATLG